MEKSTGESIHQDLSIQYHKCRCIFTRRGENACRGGWTVCLQVIKHIYFLFSLLIRVFNVVLSKRMFLLKSSSSSFIHSFIMIAFFSIIIIYFSSGETVVASLLLSYPQSSPSHEWSCAWLATAHHYYTRAAHHSLCCINNFSSYDINRNNNNNWAKTMARVEQISAWSLREQTYCK